MNRTKKNNDRNDGLRIAVPTAHAPAPPAGAPAGGRRPYKAIDAEVAWARAAADEIDASPGLGEELGPHVPSPAPLAEGLRHAQAWSEERRRAEEWLAYVSAQAGAAWNEVLVASLPLRRAFEHVLGLDPQLAARYPALAQLLGARRATHKKGARKKKTSTPPTTTKLAS